MGYFETQETQQNLSSFSGTNIYPVERERARYQEDATIVKKNLSTYYRITFRPNVGTFSSFLSKK